MKKQKIILIMIISLAVLTIYNSLGGSHKTAAKLGLKAPSFSLNNLDGHIYKLVPGNGKPIVLNFWASWCEPCRDEMPEFMNNYNQYKDQIDIVAINVTGKDNIVAVSDFVNNYHISLPVLLDPQIGVTETYNIVQIPTTYFIDKRGIIVDRKIGSIDAITMHNKILNLLK